MFDMTKDEFSGGHWPTKITLRKGEKLLEITFDDGSLFELPA